MSKLEKIKERIPYMLNFAPISMVVALLLMFMGDILIVNHHILDSIFGREENFFKVISLLIMSFFIFGWASLHHYGFSFRGRKVAYGVATFVMLYLGVEILFSDHHIEVVFFKSFFITLGFILGYILVPFWKKRDENLQLLIYIHHLRYAFLGSLRLGILFVLGLIIISATIEFLFNLRLEKFFLLVGFNGFFGYFFYLFILQLMQNPYELRYNFKEEGERSYITLLLYAFTAIIFTALNLFVLKIVLTQELPRGQVAWMVMGFSFFAFLSYLSLLPYVKKVKRFSRLIWGTLLLQSFVLLASIFLRVSEYGFTEKRYLLVAYGLWMMGISLYFLWQHEKAKIFWLFASLWLIVLVSQIGPLSGYSVSCYSQQSRLSGLYQKFKESKSEDKEHQFSDMYSIIKYLKKYHGVESVPPAIMGLTEREVTSYKDIRSFLGLKREGGVESINYGEIEENRFSYSSRYKSTFNVKEYDYFLTSLYMTDSVSRRELDRDTILYFSTNLKTSEIIVSFKKREYRISIEELLYTIKNNNKSLSESDLVLTLDEYPFKLVFEITQVSRYNSLIVEANIFVKLKDEK